jgi:hypothetical protein
LNKEKDATIQGAKGLVDQLKDKGSRKKMIKRAKEPFQELLDDLQHWK